MTKYNEQFKLTVVRQYLDGRQGYKSVANDHLLHHVVVKRWVDRYRLHGIAGLQKKFSHYDAEFKLAVLQRMWDEQLSYGEVTALFDIRSPGVVGHWERCYHSGGIDALRPRTRGRPKKMPDIDTPKAPLPTEDENRTREQLVAEVNHLRMEVAYLKKLRALVQAQQQQQTSARKKRK